jgi:hypothetical protein
MAKKDCVAGFHDEAICDGSKERRLDRWSSKYPVA